MSVAVGIDLGTTNSVVAAVVDGVAVTLPDENGARLLPSIVSFHPSGNVLVGEAARDRRLLDPLNTIYSIKPLIGRAFASEEVKAASTRFPFRIVEGAKGGVSVVARDTRYSLPEISAFVLRRAKAIAEAALGMPVERAVITVPANFNDLQRAATKLAGKLAGLDVIRILNEPTAAALAYGQSATQAEKIAIYDLGGGTFDVTLLDLTGNVFEVLATAGDSALGGDDVDKLIAEKLSVDFLQKYRSDPRADPLAFGRLRIAAEDLKKKLSAEMRASCEVTELGHGPDGKSLTGNFTLMRDELERMAKPLVQKTIDVAKQSIEVVGLTSKDFDRVILVGGSTRIPLVGRTVESFFGKPAHRKVNPDEVVALGAAIQANALSRTKVTTARKGTMPGIPDPAAPTAEVGKGSVKVGTGSLDIQATAAYPAPAAAPQPATKTQVSAAAEPAVPNIPSHFDLSKAPAVITFSAHPPAMGESPKKAPQQAPKKVPAPISFELEEPATEPNIPELVLGPAASPIALPSPAIASPEPFAMQGFATEDFGAMVAAGSLFSGVETAEQVNGEVAFARGSAVATSGNSPLLIDVTPLSLRVETVGGYSDVLIAANSPVPCEKARTFLTASDRQTTVRVRVAQGEVARFAENTFLGELELTGLAPAPRGSVKIMVTFELDADGILNVRAKDRDTGVETKATMRLLGASTDNADLAEMQKRQANHAVV